MNKLLAIIRREYLARVRSRWFVFTTIFAPVLLIGAVVLPILLATRQVNRQFEISAVDESGEVIGELLKTDAFTAGRLRFRPPPRKDAQAAMAELRQLVVDGQLSGYLYLPADVLDGGSIEYWGRDVGQTLLRGTLAPALNTAVQRVWARQLELAPDAVNKLVRPIDLQTYRLTEEGTAIEQEHAVITAQLLGLAIYMVVLLYGAMMLRAAVSEKASKMIEIILSSVRPAQLMLAKTLGVGAVGLTQVGVWLGTLGLFLLYAAGAQAFADAEFLKNLPIGPDTFALFVGLFITGYFLYAGMYASAGAIASTEQEASQLQIPVTVLAILPLMIIILVLENPSATSSVVLSWIPFFTPVLFLARYVLATVAPWEIPLVFVLQVAAILLITWLGGRIYRVGLLMTGKRPSLPELIRWIRYG